MSVASVEFVLIAARAVFLVFSFSVAAVTFTRWRRATLAQTERGLAHQQLMLQRLAELEAHLAATNAAISRLGERIERPQQIASHASSPPPGYQIAIRLAKGGASREELVAGCGLSIHEAELVQRLHSPQAAGSGRPASGPRAHAA
jgi:alkylation response protein AidB-like acyl-CoA dehydrogenase